MTLRSPLNPTYLPLLLLLLISVSSLPAVHFNPTEENPVSSSYFSTTPENTETHCMSSEGELVPEGDLLFEDCEVRCYCVAGSESCIDRCPRPFPPPHCNHPRLVPDPLDSCCKVFRCFDK